MALTQITSDVISSNTIINAMVPGTLPGAMLANGSVGVLHIDTASANGTGALKVPAGTTEQRPAGANGQFRLNTTTGSFEGYTNGVWGAIAGSSVGGSSSGGANTGIFFENSNQITANYTSPSGKNMFSVGPIVMNTAGILVQITGNAVWKVI